MIKKNTMVRIENIVLSPENRSSNLPEDTRKTPLKMWVKGRLNFDAELGEEVEITTITGRIVKGILKEINPVYELNYGEYVPELQSITEYLQETLRGVSND